METKWEFTKNNDGSISGIGEAGIETFKSTPYSSLTREICQNSLDAVLNKNEPVIVEFNCFDIKNKDFLGHSDFLKTWECMIEFSKKYGDDKTMKFLDTGAIILNSDEIPILRISDFNTVGLQGSDKQDYNTNWISLVKSSGVSNKSSSAGGSFGIGKSAPFACSSLRTVIYSTVDKDNVKATQGVARLLTHKVDDNLINATGYYGAEGLNPIKEIVSIDKFYDRKNETGTDIYIMGFKVEEKWYEEIIKVLLEDFLVAIYEGKLIVKIDNIEICKDTLQNLINEYKDKLKFGYNYYKAITEGKKIIRDFKGMGNIELFILIEKELHRKVCINRSNGMKIFDKGNISGAISFCAIMIMRGDEVSEFFRKMENPQHNEWKEGYFEGNEKDAKQNKKDLFKMIKESILENTDQTNIEEIELNDIIHHIPYDIIINDKKKKKSESIPEKVKEISIRKSKKINFRPNNVKKYNNYEEEIAVTMSSEDDEISQVINKPTKSINIKNNMPFQFEKKCAEISKEKVLKKRMFNTGYGKYTLILNMDNKYKSGYINVFLSGEKGTVKASVISAKLDDCDEPLKCSLNKIYLFNIIPKTSLKICFEIEHKEMSGVEVQVYESTK